MKPEFDWLYLYFYFGGLFTGILGTLIYIRDYRELFVWNKLVDSKTEKEEKKND